MKTTLIVLAALGVTSAEESRRVQMSRIINKHVPEKFDFFHLRKAMKEMDPKCEIKPEDQMRTLDFLRKINYQGYNAFVKNFYDESDANPISEECLGDWMDEDFDNFLPVFKKLMKGHWYEISLEEAKAAVDGALNIFYKNKNECKFNYIRNDMIKTCLDNKEDCLFFQDAMKKENTLSVMFPIVEKAMEIVELLQVDDTCYTDKELIEEYEKIWADIGSIVRKLTSFEGHLDLTKKQHHQSIRRFLGKVIRTYIDEAISEADDVYQELPIPNFNKPLGHWGENPMMTYDQSQEVTPSPVFEKEQPKPAFGLFGRPDEMDFMHFPKLEFPDLHLF